MLNTDARRVQCCFAFMGLTVGFENGFDCRRLTTKKLYKLNLTKEIKTNTMEQQRILCKYPREEAILNEAG